MILVVNVSYEAMQSWLVDGVILRSLIGLGIKKAITITVMIQESFIKIVKMTIIASYR